MAVYTRLKTWISEVLFSADLNAEFNAIANAVNNIGTEQIVPAAVTADELAANAVETGKIKALAVTGAKIAANAVTALDQFDAGGEVDLDTITTEFDVAAQDLTLASPAGVVLLNFDCQIKVGQGSSSGEVNVLTVRVYRDETLLATRTVKVVYQSTEFDLGEDVPFALSLLDESALAASSPEYRVTFDPSVVFNTVTTAVGQRNLVVAEFRR